MKHENETLSGYTLPPMNAVPPEMAGMPRSGKRISRNVLLAAISLVALVADLRMALAEQFEPPSLDGFVLHSEREGDGDGDGVNETMISQYMNQNGDSLFSMVTNGQTWAWSLNTRDSELGPDNYVIRDSDCDGVFDEVYGLDDEFQVPECVK
jgi:hypothetical protein